MSRYPQLADVALADYKVRILGWKGGTSATTRVLIDTTDGVGEWTTVGVHDEHRRGLLARPRRRADVRRDGTGG